MRLFSLTVLQFLVTAVHTYKITVDPTSPLSVNNTSCWTVSSNWACATLDLGLQGLHYMLANRNADDSTVVLVIAAGREYELTVDNLGEFNGVDNVAIQANSLDGTYSFNSTSSSFRNDHLFPDSSFNGNASVLVTCSSGIGFSFINSTGITISGISFVNCGQLQTSTSINQTTYDFIKTVVAFYFLYCSNVVFRNVNIFRTEGTAIYLYNVVGNNTFESCIFENNNFTEIPGGGGVYIEYSYCVPTGNDIHRCINKTKSESNVIGHFIRNGYFILKGCKFLNNKAYFPLKSNNVSYEPYVYMVPGQYQHSAFGTGGGLSIYFKGNSSKNYIHIENCLFEGNVALWGGGLFVQFEDYANNNVLNVKNSNFSCNIALYKNTTNDGTAGGGSRLAFFLQGEQGNNNSVRYRNCSFNSNEAHYGGGFSFYSRLWNTRNNITFHKCCFISNKALIGSAIDLSTTQWINSNMDGSDNDKIVIVPYVYMRECEYRNHNSRYDALISVGSVNQNGVKTIIEESAFFIGNHGSAVSLNHAAMIISNHTNVTFLYNAGQYGGAVAMFGSAHLVVGDNSNLNFTLNKAKYLGGAIYHTSLGVYDFIYSRDCFIQYHDLNTPPKNWTARFIFSGNEANGVPNAMYASTLLPCKRDIHFASEGLELFCIASIWEYVNQTCYKQIATAPTGIEVPSLLIDNQIPGKLPIELNYTLYDSATNFQVASNTSLVVSLVDESRKRGACFKNGSNFDIISHNHLYMNSQEGTLAILQLETIDPIAVKSHVSVRFLKCPPAFEFDNSSSKCKCIGDYSQQVICDQTKFEARIVRTSWMGPLNGEIPNSSNDLYVGFSPFVMKASSSELILLPLLIDDLNDVLCNKTNRNGTLCGKCKSGYGVSVNTKDYDCVPCPAHQEHVNWIFYILSEFVPVTVFFALVFLFSMRITHGPLNSFVFFSQTVTTVIQMDAHGLTPIEKTVHMYNTYKKIYMTPYDFWNLNFFNSILPGFCLNDRLGTLDVLMLGYITALYPLLLIIVLIVIIHFYNRSMKPVVAVVRPFHYLLARFRQLTNLRQSITSGIAVFILMSYNKFATVSFYLIPCYHLFSADGKARSAVFYHQGSVKYPEEGIVYIVTALSVLSLCIILPILFTYPLLLILLGNSKFLRKRVTFEKLHPGHKVQAFLDEFYGCYKNGSGEGEKDCRWFVSLYFTLRLILLLTYSQVATWQKIYMVQSIIFLICTVVFATIRPYRKDWINNLDVTAFAILTAISTLSLYNLQLATLQKEISIYAFYVQFFLIILPIFGCWAYYLFLLFQWYREKYNSNCFGRKKNVNITTICTDEEDDRQFDESTYITRFFSFVGMSGRYIQRQQPSRSVVSLSVTGSQNYGALTA